LQGDDRSIHATFQVDEVIGRRPAGPADKRQGGQRRRWQGFVKHDDTLPFEDQDERVHLSLLWLLLS
jgi:hypothetical protein